MHLQMMYHRYIIGYKTDSEAVRVPELDVYQDKSIELLNPLQLSSDEMQYPPHSPKEKLYLQRVHTFCHPAALAELQGVVDTQQRVVQPHVHQDG